MLQLPKLINLLPSFSLPGGGIRLPKVQVHDIEERPEKRARTLKHLLKANHINHSIIYNELRFHNHTPHILGSAYILGADADQLNHIYDVESKNLESWKDSPGEIAKHDWRDFLGKREYVGRRSAREDTRVDGLCAGTSEPLSTFSRTSLSNTAMIGDHY